MFVDRDLLRARFATAMSSMYRAEVPLYGDLIDIVRDVNAQAFQNCTRNGQGNDASAIITSSERLTLERHGAIRLGTPFELRTVKRIFGLLGLQPVGYYDLSIAGLPMHATCFRPTSVSSLDQNPFRVFTTLLRPELLASAEARQLALELLDKRKIFSNDLLDILVTAEAQGGWLTEDQAKTFIPQALATFSWQCMAAATFDQYQTLKAEHPILADIASFQSAHINHLTPRTLEISAVQSSLKAAGMAVKAHIEGPPPRKCPILLRQTSFLALEEAVQFRQSDLDSGIGINVSESRGALIVANHKARFGEIEQRGAAVTPKGRYLYDRLLHESQKRAAGANADEADAIATEVFKEYPDTWPELWKQGLIYCHFHCTKKGIQKSSLDLKHGSLLEHLIDNGVVEASPITYEDFLPFSAAGIFQSNLQSGNKPNEPPKLALSSSDQYGLEEALGAKVFDLHEWYANVQSEGLERVSKELGIASEALMLR
ncbi:uncharacterized protein ASPGLDRAFT_70634 [Aspergillus glaucus CBS 516.65]|uniref:2-oxoadipate dioxygenase/decarboxylase n=1 Tax=Aspergillus glaucus CBS 516.65 TaxID=1160497 RepID=A0A1L9V3Z1_ASPGL|nr:hypothetical protein ASPGLDRAFT_70634 [Aspergillus glaucus CBS 516.65]OJJ78654.1 hypothetical protein ASPGLDRAFT_70634 [Aspergillus glaucus CBS 516.65]